MNAKITYNFTAMAEKCRARGLNISTARLSDYVLHGLPIKKDVNHIADEVLRDTTIEFANGFIRSLNAAGWAQGVTEKIEYSDINELNVSELLMPDTNN